MYVWNGQWVLIALMVNSSRRWVMFTFWTGSRCGQVRVRGGFQRGAPLIVVLFILSESSWSRKEHKPPHSTRPSSFTVSLSRRRPWCSWVTTTLSNRRPYSSLEPWPTVDHARLMNSALDKERDAPEASCMRSEIMRRCTTPAQGLRETLWSLQHLLMMRLQNNGQLTRKSLCSFL